MSNDRVAENIVEQCPFTVDTERAYALGEVVAAVDFTPTRFDNPKLFPPTHDQHIAVHYFFFLTAIDHRTGSNAKPYEASCNGEVYRGSDLMYFLARRALEEDPERFTAQKLQSITGEEVAALFRASSGVEILAPDIRAALLDDAARRLLERYGGDFRNVLAAADGRLEGNGRPGLLQLLAGFAAYEDPLRKKSYLLVKLLRRRGLLRVTDPEHLGIPVDNVLVTAALRSGVVQIAEPRLRAAVFEHELLSKEETFLLRRTTFQAFQTVSRVAGLEPDVLDDLLWTYGRQLLKNEADPAHLERMAVDGDPQAGYVHNPVALRRFLEFLLGLDPAVPVVAVPYPEPQLSIPRPWYM